VWEKFEALVEALMVKFGVLSPQSTVTRDWALREGQIIVSLVVFVLQVVMKGSAMALDTNNNSEGHIEPKF